MANLLYLIRYFHVVPPVPPLMRHAMVAVTVVGIAMTALGRDPGGSTVIPILVLQAFSVSSGFEVAARRGYFDLLIARGESLSRIAVLQWTTTALPGTCSWGVLVATAWLVEGTARTAMLAEGTVIAFVLVSTVPWAVTVALPRFSGAIGWLILVCLGATGGVIWPDTVRDVLFPIGIVGAPMADRPNVIAADLVLSTGSVIVALLRMRTREVPLESGQ